MQRPSVEGRLAPREASKRLGIGVRQFKRLVRAWRYGGMRTWFRANAVDRRTGG